MINILFLMLSVWMGFTHTPERSCGTAEGYYSYFEPRFKVDIYRAERSPQVRIKGNMAEVDRRIRRASAPVIS